jgi:hypothetical protein
MSKIWYEATKTVSVSGFFNSHSEFENYVKEHASAGAYRISAHLEQGADQIMPSYEFIVEFGSGNKVADLPKTYNTVEDCVTLLDNHFGQNWVNKVDLSILDMDHIHLCVLGQLFGDYYDGLEMLGISNSTHRLAFTSHDADKMPTDPQWINTIKRLRAERNPVS